MLLLVPVFAWSCGMCAVAEIRPAAAPEYAIKAVFLYNLVKYTDWPPASPLSDPSAPIVLAVIGDDPFGAALDEAVRDRTVRGRPIVIVRTSDLKALKSVHVAFICASESGRAGELVSSLAVRSVLTVGDTESTARAGAAVNFIMVQGKVRFDVNQAAAKRRNIELSSQLLKLARRVLEPEG
ncbi:MAG: YfiR family protein [Candidatus Solibacter sp.]|nr:YfiR family protein [Candidatus Solibacter sp.]